MQELNIYEVDMKYIRALHNADSNVMSQSPQIKKQDRPYVGIIVMVNGQKYCIPLTSGTKEKFQKSCNNPDLLKIPDEEHRTEQGAPKTLAVLNINNMIPVVDSVISKTNLKVNKSDSPEIKRKKALRQKEIQWCRKNYDVIERRARKVYGLVVDTPKVNRSLVKRCCDFKKLEAVLEKVIANQSQSSTLPKPTKKTNNSGTSRDSYIIPLDNPDEQKKQLKERGIPFTVRREKNGGNGIAVLVDIKDKEAAIACVKGTQVQKKNRK